MPDIVIAEHSLTQVEFDAYKDYYTNILNFLQIPSARRTEDIAKFETAAKLIVPDAEFNKFMDIIKSGEFDKLNNEQSLIKPITNQRIEMLEKRISFLEDKVDSLEKNDKQFKDYLAALNKAQDIEKNILTMENYTLEHSDVKDCKVYCFDYVEQKPYFVDEEGRKQFVDIPENSLLYNAFEKGTEFITNSYNGEKIGDNHSIKGVDNIAVVPLKDTNDGVIGVMVAKNAKDGFDNSFSEQFKMGGEQGLAILPAIQLKLAKDEKDIDPMVKMWRKEVFEKHKSNVLYEQYKEGKSIAFIGFDIDHFKSVNDEYGHSAGDDTLRKVTQRVRDCLPTNASVYRVGGEEFTVVIISDADTIKEDTARVAENIRTVVAASLIETKDGNGKDISFYKTLSLGASALINTDKNCSDITKEEFMEKINTIVYKTDSKLYDSKHGGRNQVQVSEELTPCEKPLNYTITDLKYDENISKYGNPLLAESGIDISQMSIAVNTEKGVFTAEIQLKSKGDAVILFEDETYTNPKEFPQELIDAIKIGKTSDYTVASNTKTLECSCIVYDENKKPIAQSQYPYDLSEHFNAYDTAKTLSNLKNAMVDFGVTISEKSIEYYKQLNHKQEPPTHTTVSVDK